MSNIDEYTMPTKDAAVLLNRTTKTLKAWRHEKRGPTHVLKAGRAFYRRADIEEYAEALNLVRGRRAKG